MTDAFCAVAPEPKARIVQVTAVPSVPAPLQSPVPAIWNVFVVVGATSTTCAPLTNEPAKAAVQTFAAVSAVPLTPLVALRCAQLAAAAVAIDPATRAPSAIPA